MDNTKGLYDKLISRYYTTPALVPPMPWLDAEAPSAPKQLRKETDADGYIRLTWQEATDNDTKNAPMYVIYASDTYPVDTEDASNILAQRITGTTYTYAPLTPWSLKLYYAVTAIDRYGNESEAVQLNR